MVGVVQDATLALESADTLGDRWAEKNAMAYRLNNVVSADEVTVQLCSLANKAGPVFYRLSGTRSFSSPYALYLSAPFLCNGEKSTLCTWSPHYAGDMHRR